MTPPSAPPSCASPDLSAAPCDNAPVTVPIVPPGGAGGVGCGGAEDDERAGEQDGGPAITKFKAGHDLTSRWLSSEAGVTTGDGMVPS